MATARCTEPTAAGSPCLRAGTPRVTNTACRQDNHRAAPPPPLAGKRGRGGRGAGPRSAKSRPFLNFAPVAVEPVERRERTHRRPPPGTSSGEKERGSHVPRALVRLAAPWNLLWEPPPALASGIPLPPPRVLRHGRCLRSAPVFTAERLSGLARRQIGAPPAGCLGNAGIRPQARALERRGLPGSAGAGRPPVRSAPGAAPPASVPAAAVALEAEPSRAAECPRHEAQLHPATEGL